jgi:hypothetical protein
MTTVEGSPRDFRAGTPVGDHAERVWQLWTTPSTWSTWDRGLRAAALDGAFTAGATGTVVGLDGRRSRFVVDEGDPGRRTRWHVPLPGGRMELVRTLGDGRAEHRVRFTGPAAPVWAAVLGRRFRPMLGPTLDALLDAARTRA